MFLTNNFRTINNLMVYSKGEYINKIIINYSGYRRKAPDYWIKNLQLSWCSYLKNKTPNNIINFTLRPYGNVKKLIRLRTNEDGELTVCDVRGDLCS